MTEPDYTTLARTAATARAARRAALETRYAETGLSGRELSELTRLRKTVRTR